MIPLVANGLMRFVTVASIGVLAVASPPGRKEADLLEAVRDEAAAAISQLVEAGANVNAQWNPTDLIDREEWLSCGTSPLLEAIRKGNADLVQLLIRLGADVNLVRTYRQPNRNIASAGGSCTPLTVAAGLANEPIVRILIHAGADVNGETDFGDYPLHSAAWTGNTRVVKALLEAGADLSKEDRRPQPAAMIAAHHVDVIRLLVQAGLSERQKVIALHRGSFVGALPTVEFLVRSGVDPDSRDERGRTALMWARRPEVVEALVAAGGDARAVDRDGASALIHITGERDEEGAPVADALIKAGADVSQADVRGNTPIVEAARYGRRRLIERLLAAEADVNARGGEGLTALMLAARMSDSGIVGLLLRAGAAVNATDAHGETALMKAAGSDSASNGVDCDTMRFLLSAGARIDAVREDGKTALAIGKDNRHRCVTEKLLKAGAR